MVHQGVLIFHRACPSFHKESCPTIMETKKINQTSYSVPISSRMVDYTLVWEGQYDPTLIPSITGECSNSV